MSEDHELNCLRNLFLEQTVIFRNLIFADDRRARFRLTRSLPDSGKNWFIWFNPSSWGHPISAGIHWALISSQSSKRPSGVLHLALGVEDLREDLYAEEFKHQVANEAYEKGVVPINFRLFGKNPRQKKLLESISIPLDETTASKAYIIYKKTQNFNVVVARTIREFDKAGYFAKTLTYICKTEE
jgi:hypothetical protein